MLDSVHESWEDLQKQSKEKAKRLQDAQKRELFVHEADEVLAWISDKEAVASSEELGRDLEHVQMLQKKFSDFSKVTLHTNRHCLIANVDRYSLSAQDLQVNEARVTSVNTQANRLLGEEHPDSEVILGRQEVRHLYSLSSLMYLLCALM